MKKFLKYFFLVILTIVVLSYFFDFNPVNIGDVKVCEQLSENTCPMDKPIFETSTPQIYVTCKLNNPLGETQVQFSWFYLTDDRTEIDAVVLSNGDDMGNIEMYSSLNRPNNGWPKGDYEVVIKILDTEKDPISKSFYVR